MPLIASQPRVLPTDGWTIKLAAWAVVAMPVFLFHARAAADVALTLSSLLFLFEATRNRYWRWVRQPWFLAAMGLWLVLIISSARMGPQASLNQALVVGRLFIFCAAMEQWIGTNQVVQRWLPLVLKLLAAWLMIEVWQQYLTGTNLGGYKPWADGAITGPFEKPHAGVTFVLMMFATLLPAVITRLHRPDWRDWAKGCALLLSFMATMILIGQRMPNLLALFGVALSALVNRRLRIPALIGFVLAAALLAALPEISPPTYQKLVLRFTEQMTHFASDPYGQIYTRATEMVIAHPWIGVGYDGFRYLCNDPQYMRGLRAYGIPTALVQTVEGCNIHTHNYYFQIASASGLIGIGLFLAMVASWFVRLLRLTAKNATAQQNALFVQFCVYFWPIASTLSLFVMDAGGWVFLITGWALAETRRRETPGA